MGIGNSIKNFILGIAVAGTVAGSAQAQEIPKGIDTSPSPEAQTQLVDTLNAFIQNELHGELILLSDRDTLFEDMKSTIIQEFSTGIESRFVFAVNAPEGVRIATINRRGDSLRVSKYDLISSQDGQLVLRPQSVSFPSIPILASSGRISSNALESALREGLAEISQDSSAVYSINAEDFEMGIVQENPVVINILANSEAILDQLPESLPSNTNISQQEIVDTKPYLTQQEVDQAVQRINQGIPSSPENPLEVYAISRSSAQDHRYVEVSYVNQEGNRFWGFVPYSETNMTESEFESLPIHFGPDYFALNYRLLSEEVKELFPYLRNDSDEVGIYLNFIKLADILNENIINHTGRTLNLTIPANDELLNMLGIDDSAIVITQAGSGEVSLSGSQDSRKFVLNDLQVQHLIAILRQMSPSMVSGSGENNFYYGRSMDVNGTHISMQMGEIVPRLQLIFLPTQHQVERQVDYLRGIGLELSSQGANGDFYQNQERPPSSNQAS